MKLKLYFVTAFMAVSIFAGSAFAGDFATLNFIGFSRDGRYLAFEEYGVQDGSGFPYSNYYFVETAKNAFATPRVRVVLENEFATEQSVRNRAALQAAKHIKRFGIVKGNTGKQVVSHLMNDLTFEDRELATKVSFVEEIGSMYKSGEYQLTLKPVKVKAKGCEIYDDDPVMMDLTISNKGENSPNQGVTWIRSLQKDSALPAERGCPIEYRLQAVHLYKETIAVFINVFVPGFEGPDMRFMAVTGRYKIISNG